MNNEYVWDDYDGPTVSIQGSLLTCQELNGNRVGFSIKTRANRYILPMIKLYVYNFSDSKCESINLRVNSIAKFKQF